MLRDREKLWPLRLVFLSGCNEFFKESFKEFVSGLPHARYHHLIGLYYYWERTKKWRKTTYPSIYLIQARNPPATENSMQAMHVIEKKKKKR